MAIRRRERERLLHARAPELADDVGSILQAGEAVFTVGLGVGERLAGVPLAVLVQVEVDDLAAQAALTGLLNAIAIEVFEDPAIDLPGRVGTAGLIEKGQTS